MMLGVRAGGRNKVRAVGVALDLPSALSEARERATPILARLKRAGLDADLHNDLGRAATAEVLVLPIVVLGRCVALLYGDDGDAAVEYRRLARSLPWPLSWRVLSNVSSCARSARCCVGVGFGGQNQTCSTNDPESQFPRQPTGPITKKKWSTACFGGPGRAFEDAS